METIPVQNFNLVIFGATGDLTRRKLLPALYLRDLAGQMPGDASIIGVARTDLGQDGFRQQAKEAIETFVDETHRDPERLAAFLNRLDYMSLDANAEDGWPDLAERLDHAQKTVCVFYLAVGPQFFGPICQRLKSVDLSGELCRLVVEKPLGRDLESATALNAEIAAVFDESRVYRIDHYLGKETVQNLLALRFANSMFEPLWNAAHIDHVQITVAETVGLEGRGSYYDAFGAMRDMVQNHLLQLLCLVAMEPPARIDADSVRDEKLKVLRSLRPIEPSEIASKTVRGRYEAGAVDASTVPSYKDEPGVPEDSKTETFVALKVEIDNWRWAGVPFYLRTGKRLPAKISEIVIHFHAIPHSIFAGNAGELVKNRLVVRLQPDEGIRMHLMTKDPGPGGLRLREASLNLSFADAFDERFPDAYERLLMDVVRGNPTLFMRRDEVEAAWKWSQSILTTWEENADQPKPYIAGTWGPSSAIALIERDGRTWHE